MITPINKERSFQVGELFFSTTNDKGIISSVNSTFARISGYEETAMLGQPHSMVRHPDMPRIVFKLLWEYLESGRPIAAYVKNMASDGAYYWVMASAAPIESGYISVRCKPTSAIFTKIPRLYADLLAAESKASSKKEAVELGRIRLNEILRELGFEDYSAFMHAALPAELKARDEHLGVHTEQVQENDDVVLRGCRSVLTVLRGLFSQLDSFVGLNQQLSHKSTFVMELANEIRLLSQNALVAARRLESSGVTLSKVATIMGSDSDEAASIVRGLTGDIASAVNWLGDLAFQVSVARLQAEVAAALLGEVTVRDPRVLSLSRCSANGTEQVFGSLNNLDRDLRRVADQVERLATVLHPDRMTP